MSAEDFYDEMDDLVSAEDFLEYFDIPFDARVVQVNRLHILQRFHNILAGAPLPEDYDSLRAVYINALTKSYESFIDSDAQTEKVLSIFKRSSGTSFVGINTIGSSSSE